MRRRLAALLVLFAALPGRADDSRYQDYPVGSRAMTLGGAFVALSNDPSGLTYNPAGACDMHKLNVNVSASLYGLERQSRGDLNLVGAGTFSLATLSNLNVIPGEAGFLKGFGAQDARGSEYAAGFDVTVPSFRTYGIDVPAPNRSHSRVVDRTFDVAAGGGMRVTRDLNLGLSLHYVLRLFDQVEDSLITDGAPVDPKVGTYNASGQFNNSNLVLQLGAKVRLDDDRWQLGASLSLPGVHIYSAGQVSIQDVVLDPAAPSGQKSTVTTLETADVQNSTPVPLMFRVGAARVEPGAWTLSAQLTVHAGATYQRFGVPDAVARRLRMQSRIDRSPVADLNLGGEYLINRDWSAALGFFTSNSGAPALATRSDGSLEAGSSHLPNVSLVGGTATLGMLGNHSITRLGLSVSYGSGEDAVPADPTGVFDPTGYTRAAVRQLFLYVFLASTFRY